MYQALSTYPDRSNLRASAIASWSPASSFVRFSFAPAPDRGGRVHKFRTSHESRETGGSRHLSFGSQYPSSSVRSGSGFNFESRAPAPAVSGSGPEEGTASHRPLEMNGVKSLHGNKAGRRLTSVSRAPHATSVFPRHPTRVKKDVLRLLNEDRGAHCSTMFDYYGLGQGFPGTPLPANLANIDKVNVKLYNFVLDCCLTSSFVLLYEREAFAPALVRLSYSHSEACDGRTSGNSRS
jgi:hypothetical protein